MYSVPTNSHDGTFGLNNNVFAKHCTLAKLSLEQAVVTF